MERLLIGVSRLKTRNIKRTAECSHYWDSPVYPHPIHSLSAHSWINTRVIHTSTHIEDWLFRETGHNVLTAAGFEDGVFGGSACGGVR